MLGTVSPDSPPGQCNVVLAVLPTGDLVQIHEPIHEFVPSARAPRQVCVMGALGQRVIATSEASEDHGAPAFAPLSLAQTDRCLPGILVGYSTAEQICYIKRDDDNTTEAFFLVYCSVTFSA